MVSTPLSLATTTRSGRSRLGSLGSSRMRSFWPSLTPPSRPRGPSAVVTSLMSSGRTPRSRSTEPTELALLQRRGPLAPGIAAGGLRGGLGQQGDVFRRDAGLEARIGVGLSFGRVGHLDGGLAVGRQRAGAADPDGGVAHPHHHLVHGQHRRQLGLRQHRGEIARDEGHFRIRLGARVVGRRGAAGQFGFRQHLLRVEGRDVGRQLRQRHCEVAGDPHEGAYPHELAIAHMGRGADPNDLAVGVDLAGRRQPIALAQRGDVIRQVADRAAQRDLDPLRHGGEIGLPVERCENGAAHESSAAKTGQDGAAEPLDRDPAAVDRATRLAIYGKRRLVAEIQALGVEIPVDAAPLAVFQGDVPAASRMRADCRNKTIRKAPNAAGRPAPTLRPRQGAVGHNAVAHTVRLKDRARPLLQSPRPILSRRSLGMRIVTCRSFEPIVSADFG